MECMASNTQQEIKDQYSRWWYGCTMVHQSNGIS